MGNLSVLFAVPASIEAGLVTGQYQRVGGVIVDSSSKQIAAWLRESPILGESTQEVATGVLGVMTQFAQIAPVLNLGMLVLGFVHINNRLNRISDGIHHLGDTILAEFARDRETQFKVTLEAVQDVFEGDERMREDALRSAVDGLVVSRENFLKDFESLLRSEQTAQALELTQYLLGYAMYAETTRIRCYLAVGQKELARKKMIDALPIFYDATKRFVLACMGEHPALFLHQDFDDNHVERFFKLQSWLHDEYQEDETILSILNQLRGDFWNKDIIGDKFDNIFQQITFRPKLTWKDTHLHLTSALKSAEAMIENYQRLQGFELELRAERLIDDFVSYDNLSQHRFAVIVDEDFLNPPSTTKQKGFRLFSSKPPRQ